jgi:RimJ/RimL family protein N-acetyltransferase
MGDVTTSRLALRRFAPDDADDLVPVFEDSAVWRFPYGRGLTPRETDRFVARQVRHWDELGFGLWIARLLGTGELIGYLGLSVPSFAPALLPAVEVGWRLTPAAWGFGYATEGATAALDEAFTTLRLAQVCSLPQAENPASVRVAERLGMRVLGTVWLPATAQRGPVAALHFEITADEWAGRERT